MIEVGPKQTKKKKKKVVIGEGREVYSTVTCCQGTFIRDFQTIKYAAATRSSSLVAHEKIIWFGEELEFE